MSRNVLPPACFSASHWKDAAQTHSMRGKAFRSRSSRSQSTNSYMQARASRDVGKRKKRKKKEDNGKWEGTCSQMSLTPIIID